MKQLRYIILMFTLCTLTAVQAQNSIPSSSQRYVPQAIDLGLPSGTLWADRNMAVNDKASDFGDYYSWGSTVSSQDAPLSQSSWRDYKYGNGPKALTKYCTDSTFGKKDGKVKLEPDDDAASSYAQTHKVPFWDAKWHIPTADEFAELIEKCKWTWTSGGYQVTGPNGKSIFLPAAGMEGRPLLGMGNYWTSTLCDDFPCYAYAVIFDDEFIAWNNASRFSGYSIRPVRSKK